MTAPATARPTAPHRLATTLFTLVLPLAVLGAGALTAWSWSASLPDQVAVHWDARGGADGFGPLGPQVAIMVAVGAALALGAWALGFFWGRDSSTRRIAAGTSTGMAVFLTLLVLGTLHAQRGLDDAADVGGVGGAIGLAVAAGLVVGTLVAYVQPGDAPHPTTQAVPAEAERVALGDHERAAWTRTATGRGVVVAVGVATGTVGVLAAVLTLPAMWLLALVLAAVLAATAVFRVRVDASGLTVRSALGWPRRHVPLDEVVAARSVTVRPLAEFGGWGYRVGADGRVGVVVRGGDALLVERTGGRRFVVTVDDAATAAALLNTLADRSRRGPAR